ncbi:hypothetical protein [Reichenbachiella sp.]
MRKGIKLLILLIGMSCEQKEEVRDYLIHVPELITLSGKWVSTDTVDMEPSIRNFQGQATLNRDLTSISWLAAAPYTGGYHTGTMRVNGKTPICKLFKWEAHQALRKTEIDSISIQSATRMVPDKHLILWEVIFKNESKRVQELVVEQDQIGFVSKFGGEWQWWYPYPKLDGSTTTRDDETENIRDHLGQGITSKEALVTELINGKPTQTKKVATWPSDMEIMEAEKFITEERKDGFLTRDTSSAAMTAFQNFVPTNERRKFQAGGTSFWNFSLKPGASKIVRFAMAFGDDREAIDHLLDFGQRGFVEEWDQVETVWNDRWYELFKRDNNILSGTFPILETDDERLKKVYYKGPLTMLYLMHTNLPQHEKVFLTGGPRWGASITFFWDITEWATLWAVVDPEMMKEHLTSWIGIDPSSHYGQDNFGGSGVGNGYSANYWALFQMIRSYVTVSGDMDYLDQIVKDKTVLQHLEAYATNWKRISIYGQNGAQDEVYKLADFGDDEWNLLECVPTYKHIVPSFNAGYIWMMRETAELLELRGEALKAAEMKTEAEEMVGRLLQLYAGNGVWNSLYPNGEKIEVRHCLDFMFLGRYIPDDIPEDIKKDMMDFVYRELITDHWMRAQSLQDVAAEDSDRADHGPLGAFDGWPAGTMDALVQLGFPQKSMDFYHSITPVTEEGIWAQAHELWGDSKLKKNAAVRIAKRGWHNRESSAGIAMSQVVLKNFFGFYPSVDGAVIQKNEGWHMEGKLYHVKYKGEYYTLSSSDKGIQMIKE